MMKSILGLVLAWIVACLIVWVATANAGICSGLGSSCGPTLECCPGLVCDNGCKLVPGTTTTTVPGATTTTTLPSVPNPNKGVFQPTYADVSIRDPDPQVFFRGWQVDQAGRDKLVQTQFELTAEAVNAAESIGCSTGAFSLYTEMGTRFDCCGPYDSGRSQWEIGTQGAMNLYDRPRSILKAIQSCSLNNACAQSPLYHKGIRDLLDIRVQDGRCVVGGDFVSVPKPPFQSGGPGSDHLGIARPIKLPPPAGDALTKLNVLLESHHQDVENKCGKGPPPAIGVHAAMFAFNSTQYCQESPDKRRFCQLKAFNGRCDPAYTAEECCQRSRLTHVAMHAWGEAMKTGVWSQVRQKDTFHSWAHKCLNLKGSYKFRPPCGAASIDNCPTLTCAQAVEVIAK